MGSFFSNLLGGLGHTIADFFNGLIVGALAFFDGILTSLEHLDSLVIHAGSSIGNFFSGFLTLGSSLFPFIPAEWMALIEAGLIVLAIGLVIRKKVVG